MNSVIVGIAICGASILGLGTSALAGGPPEDVIDGNDNTWACEGEAGLPPEHCINVRSQGNTGLIVVLDGDPRWPVEGISFDPKSDDRPCPHDPAATDGTWWSPFPGAWVCHHKP
jgi:hypothetical protein